MPRSLQEGTLAVERASSALADELGRTPTVAQIAERAEMDEEEVLDVLQARESQRSVSLDAPVRREEPEAMTAADTIGGDEPGFDRVDPSSRSRPARSWMSASAL